MIEKFKIAQNTWSDRNVKASVEQIKQQTYNNNIENKKKINELIDGLDASDTTLNEVTTEVNKLDLTGTTMSTIQINNTTLLDMIYPVGSLYWSKDSTSPATLFGGTWTQIKDMFVLACGDDYANDTTGGEATHTLTTTEIPSHKHAIYVDRNTGTTGSGSYYPLTQTTTASSYIDTNTCDYAGGGQAHNNMPPYITRYCWERTN